MKPFRPQCIHILFFVVFFSTALVTVRADTTTGKQLPKSAADLVAATNQYKLSIQGLIPIYEAELAAATEALEKRKQLLSQGMISKREFEAGENAVKEAQSKLETARKQLVESDQLIAEASSERTAKSVSIPSRGGRGYSVQPALMRSAGAGDWSLDMISKVRGFFSSQFARELPISAFGQTSTHDRMGFDHRNSVDVAIHPDSGQGKALLSYLRDNGIPFIAFRSAVRGAATGAHIHIGYASHRMN